MKGLTVNAQLFLFPRVNVIVGGALFMRKKEDWERVRRLKPEVKVSMCIDMSEAMVRVCAEGIKAQFPGISDKELMEKLRERFEWSKRYQKSKRYRKLFQHV
jgi:hypothetical protein